ncbi:hypothetical protein GCM10025868_36130 [Angustibacter aerolatus]|uniref:Alcohol dehydrogenase-like N-terminal domain-containing protein n=1 Tax=Angustibacter aerolatus TaxID=1162965 RepID=A0ABQ6JJI0_9ACTN|nr:hypothetical protein GCM10025868_36130 [Angustibacter aerolatus]
MTSVLETAAAQGVWPTGTMPALQMAEAGRLEVADVEVLPPAPGRLLAKVSHVGICGTDVHLLSGHSAYVVGGLTTYPIRFGHEWTGEVVAVGDDVDTSLVGRTVVGEPFLACGQCRVCRSGRYNLCPTRFEIGVRGAVPGAAARYYRVPATNVAVVPDGVAPEHALVAEPSVTVLNSTRPHGCSRGSGSPCSAPARSGSSLCRSASRRAAWSTCSASTRPGSAPRAASARTPRSRRTTPPPTPTTWCSTAPAQPASARR